MQLLTLVGSFIEHAVGRQVEDEAADHYGHATAFGARMPLRFQSYGVLARKVAAENSKNASVQEMFWIGADLDVVLFVYSWLGHLGRI